MKNIFPGQFRPKKEEILELWDNAHFIIDTNILLNLYRYSDGTRFKFIDIFKKLDDKVWIPNQTAKEYFNNRLSVIYKQSKAYEDSKNSLTKIESEFKKDREHPYITSKSLAKFSKVITEITEELDHNKQIHDKRITEDDILEEINTIFQDKVGVKFNDEKLEEIIKEGKLRYEKKIPPGYEDKGKGNNNDYGDLILWKQIIEFSSKKETNIIFITDDKKGDWWTEFHGKTIGPRPELIEEFLKETEKTIYMYQPDQFLYYAGEHFNEKVNKEVIDEVRNLSDSDKIKRKIESTNLDKIDLISPDFIFDYENLKFLHPKKRLSVLIRREKILEDMVSKIESGEDKGKSEKQITNLVGEHLKCILEIQRIRKEFSNDSLDSFFDEII